MTIVKNPKWLCEHAHGAISPDLLVLLRRSGARLALPSVCLSLFEAYLRLTQQHLDRGDIASTKFTACVRGYIGALHSSRFTAALLTATYVRARKFLLMVNDLGIASTDLPFRALSAHVITPEAIALASEFEAHPISPELEWVWGGWGATSKDGAERHLPLYTLYAKAGRRITEEFHATLSNYIATRRGWLSGPASDLLRFLGVYPKELTYLQFKDPNWVDNLQAEFARHYFESVDARNLSIDSAVVSWNRQLVPMFDALARDNAIARPIRGFVKIRGQGKRNGSPAGRPTVSPHRTASSPLLTNIPLELPDTEACDVAFSRIHDDLAATVTWAEYEVDELWCAHSRAQRDGLKQVPGVSLSELVEHAHGPKTFTAKRQLASAKRSFSGRDLPRHDSAWVAASPSQRDMAKLIGLPTAASLLPHAALLVANHPEITTSFLDQLELYDHRGNRIGYIHTDAGWLLVGMKRRRGPDLAQQRILLSSRAKEVVDQVITLTEPLRKSLRDQGNSHWTKLFLTIASLGAIPSRQKFSEQCSHSKSRGLLATRFRETLNIEAEEAASLSRRFTLKRLRGSVAVSVYIRTGSKEKMAESLGHKSYLPELLEHYLPRPIQDFFQDRWIRVFQTGVIAHAMKNSPELLGATCFSSMSELDVFLHNHALTPPPSEFTQPTSESDGKSLQQARLLFDISEETLTLLLSVQLAVEVAPAAACERARYWSGVSHALAAYIDSLNDRPDLQLHLTNARRAATATIAAEFVYV